MAARKRKNAPPKPAAEPEVTADVAAEAVADEASAEPAPDGTASASEVAAARADEMREDSEAREDGSMPPESGEAALPGSAFDEGRDEEETALPEEGLIGEGDSEVDESRVDDTGAYLKGLLEALLFVSDHPLEIKDLARAAKIDKKRTEELVHELRAEYQNRGIRLDEVGDGYAFRSNPTYSDYVRGYLSLRPVRLSRAQMETLAIVAYRQPITRPEIDDIRGVDAGPVLKGLLERDLIRIIGKKDEPGRPMLYGTTQTFLQVFSLKSLRDLPTLREFTELNDESRKTFEEELGEEAPQGPISFEEALAAEAAQGAEGEADGAVARPSTEELEDPVSSEAHDGDPSADEDSGSDDDESDDDDDDESDDDDDESDDDEDDESDDDDDEDDEDE